MQDWISLPSTAMRVTEQMKTTCRTGGANRVFQAGSRPRRPVEPLDLSSPDFVQRVKKLYQFGQVRVSSNLSGWR